MNKVVCAVCVDISHLGKVVELSHRDKLASEIWPVYSSCSTAYIHTVHNTHEVIRLNLKAIIELTVPHRMDVTPWLLSFYELSCATMCIITIEHMVLNA